MVKESTAKSGDKTNGVVLAKVSRAVIESAIKRYLPEMAAGLKGAHTETFVLKLTSHFAEKFKNKLVECDVCEGSSPEDVPGGECPFCGTVDEEGESEEQEVVQPTNETRVSSVPAKAEKPSKPAAKAPPKGLALVPPTTIAKGAADRRALTVATLDTAVAEVIRLKCMAASAAWELGARIHDIFEKRLYEKRLSADGKTQAYKGFDPFCLHELGITPTYAYKLMDISKNFSEVDVRAFGTSKLGLLLMAPSEDREALKEKLAKGTTKREVREEVKKIRKEKGITVRTDTGREKRTGAGGRKGEKMTVANLIGKKTIKLYKRPANKKYDVADLVRARKVNDLPWGRLELENGVVQYFGVQESPAGELVLVIDTRREEK